MCARSVSCQNTSCSLEHAGLTGSDLWYFMLDLHLHLQAADGLRWELSHQLKFTAHITSSDPRKPIMQIHQGNWSVKHKGKKTKNKLFYIIVLSPMCYTNTNLVASHNTNLFSYSAGGQKSKISFTGLKRRCQQTCASSGSSRGEYIPLTSPMFWGCLHAFAHSPASHPSTLLFHHHISSRPSDYLSPS